MRAVTREDYPATDGAWRARVEKDLKRLFTMAASRRAAFFPDGIIPASALTVPTSEPGYVNVRDTGFTVPADPGRYSLGVDLTVPDRFSSAVVALTAIVSAVNSASAAGSLWAQITAGEVTGNVFPIPVQPGAMGLALATIRTPLAGLLPGRQFHVQVSVWNDTPTGWDPVAVTQAELGGTVGWFQ